MRARLRSRHLWARALTAALGLSLLAPAGLARAAGPPQATRAPATPTAPTRDASADDELFRELAPHEDEALATHRAGHWSTLRIVVIVLLIIFLFPIGIIVLIVYLIVDPP